MGRSQKIKNDKLYIRLRASVEHTCPAGVAGFHEKVYDWIERFRIHSAENTDDFNKNVRAPTIFVTYADMVISYPDGQDYTNEEKCREWDSYIAWLRTKDINDATQHFTRTMRKVSKVFKERHPTWGTSFTEEEIDSFEPNMLYVHDHGTNWTFSV